MSDRYKPEDPNFLVMNPEVKVARFSGHCSSRYCHDPIDVGDYTQRLRYGWAHMDCANQDPGDDRNDDGIDDALRWDSNNF